MRDKFRFFSTSLLVIGLFAATQTQANAQYQGYVNNCRHSYGSYMYQHPRVHAMVKDGAWGTAAGAAVGLISGRGIMHGALIGAGTGAGIGALRSGAFRWQHPMATNVGTAGLAGLGLYLAAHHGHAF